MQDVVCALVRRNSDAVVHPLTLTPDQNDTCIPQVCEVTRYFRLRALQNLDELAHAEFPLRHQIERIRPSKHTFRAS
jgi:hypothetical protein